MSETMEAAPKQKMKESGSSIIVKFLQKKEGDADFKFTEGDLQTMLRTDHPEMSPSMISSLINKLLTKEYLSRETVQIGTRKLWQYKIAKTLSDYRFRLQPGRGSATRTPVAKKAQLKAIDTPPMTEPTKPVDTPVEQSMADIAREIGQANTTSSTPLVRQLVGTIVDCLASLEQLASSKPDLSQFSNEELTSEMLNRMTASKNEAAA